VSTKLRRRLLTNLGVAVLVSSLMALAMIYGVARPIQLRVGDLVFSSKPDATAKWAVIVAIDDRSLSQLRPYGRFLTWPRQFHARVIDNLKAAGARIVAWDVLFDLPAEGDEELAESIRNAGNVVLAEAADVSTHLPSNPGEPQRYAESFQQLPALRAGAVGIGLANQNVGVDLDGIIRGVPLFFDVGETRYGALSYVSAQKFLRRPQLTDGPIENGQVQLAGRSIPIDPYGRMWVNYLGDSSEITQPTTFPILSFVDVMNNNFPAEAVRQKMVFVGITAIAFGDDFWTPISRIQKMDGVEIHANAFETILRGEFVQPAPTQLTVALIFAAGLIPALLLLVLSPFAAAVMCTFVAVGYVIAALIAVDKADIILDLPFPMASQAAAFLAMMMYRVIFEQAEQRALKGALSQYLSPDVMEEVVRDPSGIKLGGEKREMTVLFSDIRGFTSISETLDPSELVHILNRYLTRMTEIIFQHQGTVDKYMGDAIMAFWGAPKEQPDHARLACLAALEMVIALGELNKEFTERGDPPLRMGIGINTGVMAVGNMGSERRFDYTVLGDNVNLGARLEGLTKEYGSNIIVAESTLQQAGREIRARFVDLVTVKGKREPSAIYEVLGSNGFAIPRNEEGLRLFASGIERYRKRDFVGALPFFERAVELDPSDTVSTTYVERCRVMQEEPPPAEWDGVFVMLHK
jgi:adenylate cyclase